MEIIVNETKDIRSLDTHDLLKEAKESLKKYEQLEIGYKEGAVGYYTYKHLQTEIYEKSPYDDIWDFILDYNRYKVGLPIFIEIKLVRKEDI